MTSAVTTTGMAGATADTSNTPTETAVSADTAISTQTAQLPTATSANKPIETAKPRPSTSSSSRLFFKTEDP